MTQTTRPAPHNVEAEESLLGSILIDPDCIRQAQSTILRSDFFIDKNGFVYDAMLDLFKRGMPIDFVTVCDALDRRGKLSEVGGSAYISHLTDSVPTAIHAHGYARMIVDASIRRGLLSAASSIAQLAYDEIGDIESQQARAMRLVSNVRIGRDSSRSISEVSSQLYDQIVAWSQSPLHSGGVRGLSTGFSGIDCMLGGLEEDLLYILAGRPGMGKSALAFQIAHNVAKQGKRVMIFSLEMSARQVLSRLVCAGARISWESIKRGQVPDDKWELLVDHISRASELPITINDSTHTTTANIDMALSRTEDVSLVVVDHLGLLSDRAERGENETVRLGRVSWALKQIAKDYHVPMFAVHQLSREVERRDNKRPVLSDLRQSGDIEQNADDVLMMYRDDYYNQKSLTPNITEILPRKLRDGDISAAAELYFEKQFVTFSKVDHREM